MKHTEGRISVSAKRDGDEVHVTVANSSQNITARDKTKIDMILKGAVTPTGYGGEIMDGLPAVRDYVKLHCGRVWVDTGAGSETRFHVVLPLRYVMVEQTGPLANLEFIGTQIALHADDLKSSAGTLVEAGAREFVLDIHRVEFVNSMDVGILIV